MIQIDNILKKHDLRTTSYHKLGKVMIVNSNKGKLVLKPKKNQKIFDYLYSRNFDYYPNNVVDDDEYDITPFVDEVEMPTEQKMLDMVKLVSLLHNKTTYYKNVDNDEYKKIYEDINGNIDYLNSYYNDLITIIESKVYMSPPELLLARNISIIFSSLKYCKNKLDEWYESVKEKDKRRYVVLHNNLDLKHFIRSKDAYLISWDKAMIDSPIYDLYKLYKKYALNFDFETLFQKYEQNSPLLKEEKNLLYILISLPDKIELNKKMYDTCKDIANLLDYQYKTAKFISPNNTENTEKAKNT